MVKGSAGTAIVVTVIGLALLTARAAPAATYYVDPATGNDGNAGTSPAAPWKTIPGTRTTSNSGWLRSAWGAVTAATKVQPGDVITLKGGSTMTAAIGGRLLIDATFYAHGTAQALIVITVSPTWGTGPFVYDMAGVTPQQWFGLVHIQQRNYIHIKGTSAGRFVVRNANGWGLMSYGAAAAHQQGVVLDYIEVSGATAGGLDISYSDDWHVSNSVAHDNGMIGFSIGGINDQVSNNGTFTDCEAYGNGAADNSSGIRHGVGLYGAINITFRRCRAHHNGRDGFDFGTTSNRADSSATVIDSSAYDNGEDGFAANGGNGTNVFTYVNAVAFNNGQSGWAIYAGAEATLYYCIAHHNGTQNPFGGNFVINSEYINGIPAQTRAVLRNCIGYKPAAYANVYTYDSSGLTTYIDSDYNLFVPRTADSETFAETPWGSPHGLARFTYVNGPSWVGPHDRLGMAADPGFVSIGTSSFDANNYRLTSSTSPAVNAGLAIAGAGAWTVDRDGQTRMDPPEIGLFEFGTTRGPFGLRHPLGPGRPLGSD